MCGHRLQAAAVLARTSFTTQYIFTETTSCVGAVGIGRRHLYAGYRIQRGMPQGLEVGGD